MAEKQPLVTITNKGSVWEMEVMVKVGESTHSLVGTGDNRFNAWDGPNGLKHELAKVGASTEATKYQFIGP